MAAVLVGLLTAGTIRPAIADDEQNPEATAVDLALDAAESQSVVEETAIDVAIRALLCLEARDGLQKGALSRRGQEWVLVNGHRCPDEWLLFDALGF